MSTATRSTQGQHTGQSRRDAFLDQYEVMDVAVATARASNYKADDQQVGSALANLESLAGDRDFPGRLTAQEQVAIILWRLGRHQESEKQYQQLLGELRDPEQAYLRARLVVRLSEIRIDPNSAGKFDDRQQQELEQAREILEQNADTYNAPHIGQSEQLMSAISSRRGDYRQSLQRMLRGSRLKHQQGAETSPADSGRQLFAISAANN